MKDAGGGPSRGDWVAQENSVLRGGQALVGGARLPHMTGALASKKTESSIGRTGSVPGAAGEQRQAGG